jgi:predicted transposase YbfD/YdcC
MGRMGKTPKLTKAQVVEQELSASIIEYFADVEDPRREHTRKHSLETILGLSLCAVVCGADSFVGIEDFGHAKEAWLKTFLDLSNGIPSHDTLGRVFSALNPDALSEAFRKWVAEVARLTKGEVVAIDGKTLRHSFREAGSSAFVHMVSAWATSNHVVLGQVKTEEKSNEITAIPRLLELLNIKGCLVTIDAMGCQKDIAAGIVEAEADYLLAVKDNQPTLNNNVAAIFEHALRDTGKLGVDFHETRDKGHGRTEVRRCWTSDLVQSLPQVNEWESLNSIVMIESERTVGAQTSTERRYYICSRANLSAKEALCSARSHWGIENQLHWVLDVAFREDDCRVRAGFAAQNFSVMRQMALNLLKAVTGVNAGIHRRRLRAGWDHDFLLRVLAASPNGK